MSIEAIIIDARARLAAADSAVDAAAASGNALAIREANEARKDARDLLRSAESCAFVPSGDPFRDWQNLYAVFRRIQGDVGVRNGLLATARKKNQVKACVRHVYFIQQQTKALDLMVDLCGQAEAFYRAEEERNLKELAAAARAKRAALYAQESVAA